MRLIGLDLGKRRVGMALASDAIGVALPLHAFLVVSDLKAEIERLCAAIAEYEPDILVVGDPVSLDGSIGPAATWTREIAALLADRLEVEVVLVDERLSSRQASAVLADIGVKGRELRKKVDSSSAAVILTHYLESRKSPTKTSAPKINEDSS